NDGSSASLISTLDRNFINAHYYEECGTHAKRVPDRRSGDETKLNVINLDYYRAKVWPLGIILYGIEEGLRGTPDHQKLSVSMAIIELSTCVVFQEVKADDILSPKNVIWFGTRGEEMPAFGFQEGKQTLKLTSMINGAPGHTAHAINNLMRVLGVHMMSNRYDRDNHITIHWSRVEKGKEHYLERAPEESWLSQIPYDFDSVTHAPANYVCRSCELGATSVQPVQDHLWQRTMSMGHKNVLTEADIQTVNLIYSEQCFNRIGKKD
ncbi:unnamed protein product, partial [Leptosia nina]